MPAGMLKLKPNTRATVRAVDRLRAQFVDLSEPMDNAAKELTRRIWYRFAFKRDPDGQRWKPWTKSTRLAAKPGQKLMLSTRKLRDGSQFRATRKGLWLKFGAEYGIHHELGGRKLPRRSFAFATRNNHRALAPADEQYLLNAVRYQLRKAALNRK